MNRHGQAPFPRCECGEPLVTCDCGEFRCMLCDPISSFVECDDLSAEDTR
jgi:hypothetical protein